MERAAQLQGGEGTGPGPGPPDVQPVPVRAPGRDLTPQTSPPTRPSVGSSAASEPTWLPPQPPGHGASCRAPPIDRETKRTFPPPKANDEEGASSVFLHFKDSNIKLQRVQDTR